VTVGARRYAGVTIYPDDGRLTAEERPQRERVRQAAAELIETGAPDQGPIRAANGSRLPGARADESGHQRDARDSRIRPGGPYGRAASEPARPA